MEIGPGSLKLVTIHSSRDAVGALVEETLLANVRPDNVRRLAGLTFVVYTDRETAEIRDWMVDSLEEGESVFVSEFEQWSGYGSAIDRSWLLRRGH